MAKHGSSGQRLRYAVERVWYLDAMAMTYPAAIEAAAKAFNVDARDLSIAAAKRRIEEVGLADACEDVATICCPNCQHAFTPEEQ